MDDRRPVMYGLSSSIIPRINEAQLLTPMLNSFNQLPPGPIYLVRFIPQLVLPSFLLFGSSKLGLRIPLAWLLPAAALAAPGLYKALIWYKLWKVTREAERLGARAVPIVQRSSRELIQHAKKGVKHGYPGE